jgi:asparagine synthase (glutamine-hydrolysing)
VRVASDEFGSVELANRVIDQFDQPFADSSAIPTFLLCKKVREHVKVVLAGDGGDEVFGGYTRFFHADLAHRLGKLPVTALSTALAFAHHARGVFPDLMRGARKILRAAAQQDTSRLEMLSCYNATSLLPAIMQPDVFSQVDLGKLRTALQRSEDPCGRDFVDATFEVALPGDYLRKVDFMSAANGLEVRLPYLGQQLLEYGQLMPHSMRYRRGANKIVLREIARRLLPAKIVDRPKQGFGIPLDSWLGPGGRREIGEMLQRPEARITALVRKEWIQSVCRPFATDTRNSSVWSRFMLYQQVYLLWSLERWLLKWEPSF